MNRVFNYDAFKIKKSKYWWICILISMILLLIPIITASAVSNSYGANFGRINFGDVKRYIYNPAILLYFIMVSILIGNDFKTGIIKNVASKGIRRSEIVISKIIWNFIFAVAFVLFTVFAGFIGLAVFTKVNLSLNLVKDVIIPCLYLILGFFAFSSICTLFGFLAKSTGITIAISIGFNIFMAIFLPFLELLMKKPGKLVNMYPAYYGELIKGASSGKITTYVISMFVIIVVCSALSIFVFQKQDIK